MFNIEKSGMTHMRHRMSGVLPLWITNRSGQQEHFCTTAALCESLVMNKEGNNVISDDCDCDWNEYCRRR